MSSNTGTGLQSLFPDNLFRGIHDLITNTNGLDMMIHRGTHNIPYGFMGLVTLAAGTFTYVTYRDYANEVSTDLSNALDSIQSSEIFIPAQQDSLKDTTEEANSLVENTTENDNNVLDNAVLNNDSFENNQSISGRENPSNLLEKETPKESSQEEIAENTLKKDGEQIKENRKTENSAKVQSETDEQTKSGGTSKKSALSKKTVKHRKKKK